MSKFSNNQIKLHDIINFEKLVAYTHHPQYIEIITQSNYQNAYLIIYHCKKSKWKWKFNSDSNWFIHQKCSSLHLNEIQPIDHIQTKLNTLNNTTTTPPPAQPPVDRSTTNRRNNCFNAHSHLKQTNSMIQSLNDLFHASIIYRNYNKKPYTTNYLSIKSSRIIFKWLQFYSMKSMKNESHHSLTSSSPSSLSSIDCVNNQSSFSTKSCKFTHHHRHHHHHPDSQALDSTIPGGVTNPSEDIINQRLCTSNPIIHSPLNHPSNILLGIFFECGKYFIFEFCTIHERNTCLQVFNKIIHINKQINAYPEIEFTWSVSVRFKPKDYTSSSTTTCSLLSNHHNSSQCYLCLTNTELLLIQGDLHRPKLIILYQFIRQCVTRRDGQFRICTGRASPIGECEIICQLTDYTEAIYVHEQCTR
ncbi:unnamed protein product [Schistosoma turkestanicum]|nr:unnamed protein product [Schistosoma turkestanicum]